MSRKVKKVANVGDHGWREKKLYSLRNPHTSAACLYAVNDDRIEELLRIKNLFRSYFYGDSVIADGSITFFCATNPVFMALPYILINAQDHYAPLNDILFDDEYPAIRLLINMNSLKNSMRIVCDSKEYDGVEVFRYSENRLLEWLERKYNQLKTFLINKAILDDNIINNEAAIQYYSYSFLCDFVPQKFVAVLKAHLKISNSVIKEGKKRKIDIAETSEPPKQKKARASARQKGLMEASKRMKSLETFFKRMIIPRYRKFVPIKQMASCIDHRYRGMSQPTPYGKRMDRLSNRIFNEVTTVTDRKSMRVVEFLSKQPPHEIEEKKVSYLPPLPMFHYLSKMLYLHGLLSDDHIIFRQLQNELKLLRGKVVHSTIGQGKRAKIRGSK